jgi:hypothetical protein
MPVYEVVVLLFVRMQDTHHRMACADRGGGGPDRVVIRNDNVSSRRYGPRHGAFVDGRSIGAGPELERHTDAWSDQHWPNVD